MVSSVRNPNESYAQRAKRAGTSSSSITPQQNQQPTTQPSNPAQTHPPSSLKPPHVNVWAERIKEQKAHATPQNTQMPPPRTAASSQPTRDDAIPPRSPPSDLSAQLAILDQQDEHDPFIVRVPPHLSRQSSSSTNPLPATDPAAWPHLQGAEPHSNASPAYDSPFLSAAPSRQNSAASFRRHAYSPSGSVRLSRVRSSFSQNSQSASQSRAESRSASSASSPRLQIRGRALPQDDPLPPDLRLDNQNPGSSKNLSTAALPDPPNHISTSFPQVDPVPPQGDPYYRRQPIPPVQDMPPRYFLPQFAIPSQFTTAHVAGHASPPYISPHSVQGTPPYPHYPPYPAYMYRHPSLYWGTDILQALALSHFQSQPPMSSNHANASEHPALHNTELGSMSPAVTTESMSSDNPMQGQNGLQAKQSRSVMFGTIDLPEGQEDTNDASVEEEQRPDPVVEHATEQFAGFSIGVSPDEPGPSRLASRKSSARSLSRVLSSQPATNDGAKDAHSPPSREANGIKKESKWEFGTTHSEDLDGPRSPPSPSTTSPPPSDPSGSGAENLTHEPDIVNASLSHETPYPDRSMDKSETGSTTSDVWVVKDYGYGFGDHSGRGNAPNVARLEMREREKQRTREIHREIVREPYADRSWVMRQPGWRHENGIEEDKEASEQQVQVDAPRHARPRRGSFPGYGGHERGGFPPSRGRVFGGRFHGVRGRGKFFHHQRPASYPHARPPQPPPPPPPPPPPQSHRAPFEVLAPAMDMANGYGPITYVPPELEPYETVSSALQPRAPYALASYTVAAMKNCLLGQLEYYMSPQNMAQDYFLRQRMDNEGWIPISLLASFKRVQQLHTNEDMVREVLNRSTVVEVNGDWVRMGGRQWEMYVLPGAQRSLVTGHDSEEGTSAEPFVDHDGDAYAEHGEAEGEHGETEVDCDGEDCEGEDEEDEIEFVIGEEAEGSWMSVVPERKQ